MAACLIAAGTLSSPAWARQADPNFWVTNGSLRATYLSGNTLYIGGGFDYVGPYTGGFVNLDATSATVSAAWPEVDGTVLAVFQDATGGFYIGGQFTSVGGLPRTNLARIRGDRSVDPWNPGTNGPVQALAASGGVVYAGGVFTVAGGQPRNNIAALDGTTGAATAWNANADGPVSALGMQSVEPTVLWVGGSFANIGGAARANIAAVNLTNGDADVSWNPGADGPVSTFGFGDYTTTGLMVGGSFANLGGQARSNIGSLDYSTGAVTSWNPNANGPVAAIALMGGGVYVGGSFTNIGGLARNYFALIGSLDGLAIPDWNPSPDGPVNAIAVHISSLWPSYPHHLFVGGSFLTIGGQPRSRLAELDLNSGNATAWDPAAGGDVLALAVEPYGVSNEVFAFGSFASVGGVRRNNIAAIDVTTGAATGWNPDANGAVRAFAVSGDTVYIGGDFTSIGLDTRGRLAAIDAATGVATAWTPIIDGSVYDVALDGGSILVGGFFTTAAGAPRNNLASIDLATSAATSWDPDVNGPVFALALNSGIAYVGGDFTAVGGVTRNRVAALGTAVPGVLTAWDPNANEYVFALALGNGVIYAGGNFTNIGGQGRNAIAALDTAGAGAATAWNPDANAPVLALIASGATIYAGGQFGMIGGQLLARIAELDAATGAVIGTPPHANNAVYDLSLGGGALYAGGDFLSIGGRPSRGVGRLIADDLSNPTVQVLSPNGGEGVLPNTTMNITWSAADAVGVQSVELLVSHSGPGGPFVSIAAGLANTGSYLWTATGPITPNAVVRVEARDYAGNTGSDASNGPFTITTPLFARTDYWLTDGSVAVTVLSGNTLYLAGGFTRVGPQTGSFVAVDGGTAAWIPGTARVQGTVNACAPDGAGGWYVGGFFQAVSGVPRQNLAHILANGSLGPWNPGANAEVFALAASGGTVFAGGGFSMLGGQARSYLGAVDAASGLATAWNPGTDFTVNGLAVSGGLVYVCGFFNSLGGQPRTGLGAVNETTGALDGWNPGGGFGLKSITVGGGAVYVGSFFGLASYDIASGALNWATGDNAVLAVAVSGSTVYVGGWFFNIGGQSRHNIAALNAADGSATSWNPPADGAVNALAVNGSTIYAGGTFSNIGGAPRSGLGALDAGSNAATAWDPRALGSISTLGLSGSTVFAGGTLNSVGTVSRTNLAALDAGTGVPTAFNPVPDGQVNALVVLGSTVYAGGSFTTVNGTVRNNLAAMDAATGSLTAWDPGTDGPVLALATDGTTIYLGGQFGTVQGQLRPLIAGVDAVSGVAGAFAPNPDGPVNVLAAGGGAVYAAGNFTNIGGLPRTYVARLDPLTGSASPSWNAPANSGISAMLLSGTKLYAAGGFSDIGGQPSAIAALDVADGSALAWNPGISDGGVSALALYGSTLYVGGYFLNVGGVSHNSLAAVDAGTGAVRPWFPFGANSVSALAANATAVYAGSFTGFQKFDVPPGVTGVEPNHAPGLSLAPIAPNPARGPMDIRFAIARNAQVQIEVFDVVGRRVSVVADALYPAGSHRVTWHGDSGSQRAASGLYFIRMRAEGSSLVQRVILVR